MTQSVQHVLLKDFWLKLFSFAMAVLIWFTVNFAVKKEVLPGAGITLTPPETLRFSNLPVVVLSSAEDVRVVRVNPKEVEVTVQGDPRLLKKLKNSEIRAILDLTGIAAAHDFRKRLEISTPAGVTEVKVEPEEVQVIFPTKSDASAK